MFVPEFCFPDLHSIKNVLFQDLMNAADEIILQGISELGINGIDYYATPANEQGFYCCDELLVQMKDW